MITITIAPNPYLDQTRPFNSFCSEAQRLAAMLSTHTGKPWSWVNEHSLEGNAEISSLVPPIESILREQFDFVDHTFHVELTP